MKPQDRFDWERSAVRYTAMPVRDKAVAYALGTFANQDGTSIRPGTDLLAIATGLHRSTVHRALAALQNRGLIRQVSRGGGRKASEYELAVPESQCVALCDTLTAGNRVPPKPKCRPVRPQPSHPIPRTGMPSATPPLQDHASTTPLTDGPVVNSSVEGNGPAPDQEPDRSGGEVNGQPQSELMTTLLAIRNQKRTERRRP